MKHKLTSSLVVSLLISLCLGGLYAGISLLLDWRMRSKNPALFDRLLAAGEISRIFSWRSITVFMIEMFIMMLIIMCINHIVWHRKKGST